MSIRNDRRTFLSWLGAGVSGVAVAAASGQANAAASPDEKDSVAKKPSYEGGGKAFQGVSKKGSVDEALDAAIKSAMNSAPGVDRLVTWTLKEVAGREGGIAGFNEVTVTIEARIS